MSQDGSGDTTAVEETSPSGYVLKRARLKAGQVAPTSGPTSTVLLCTYRAVGLQYYKYTIGGVNIIFINLLPLIFFTIADDFIFLPAVERAIAKGHYPTPLIAFLTSQSLIFILSLASVIPLSYFIGMAVASISAQSSIGMGAVINATFGSIIEIILYSIALVQGKGRLVEGSIVGSILAGVLLMPGLSMLSGALKRKEQKFNAKSAGVTSTMLIMATIGTLTPTMFYQIYGSVRNLFYLVEDMTDG
jgi:Ca2+:H+ antiporter